MRQCGDCTLCCKLLEIHDIPSAIGEYCQYCKVSNGCMIYDARPKECSDYQCMWTMMDRVSDDLRPDRCGIIFDRIADDVISARMEGEMTPLVEAQIQSFGREGFSVIVFNGRKSQGYLQKNHSKEYVLGKVRGSADIH